MLADCENYTGRLDAFKGFLGKAKHWDINEKSVRFKAFQLTLAWNPQGGGQERARSVQITIGNVIIAEGIAPFCGRLLRIIQVRQLNMNTVLFTAERIDRISRSCP